MWSSNPLWIRFPGRREWKLHVNHEVNIITNALWIRFPGRREWKPAVAGIGVTEEHYPLDTLSRWKGMETRVASQDSLSFLRRSLDTLSRWKGMETNSHTKCTAKDSVFLWIGFPGRRESKRQIVDLKRAEYFTLDRLSRTKGMETGSRNGEPSALYRLAIRFPV